MPARTDFTRHLDREELLPIYALISGERLLLTEAVAQLRSRCVTQAADFNRDELRAGEHRVDQALQAAGTLPMMSPRRYVHFADVHRLKASELEPLLGYLERPNPTTVFVLSGEKIDQRTKLGQQLAKGGYLFALNAPRQTELAAWIAERAAAHRVEISGAAAALLADLIGTDLGSLDNALGKVAAFVGDARRVEVDDVEQTVASTRVHSIFDLTDALGRRDLTAASALLRNNLGGGENALGMLAMIARQLRHLIKVRHLKASKAPRAEWAKTLGVPPFLIDALVRQAEQYDSEELLRALCAAAEADVSLKSSRLPAEIILERLLMEITRPSGTADPGAS